MDTTVITIVLTSIGNAAVFGTPWIWKWYKNKQQVSRDDFQKIIDKYIDLNNALNIAQANLEKEFSTFKENTENQIRDLTNKLFKAHVSNEALRGELRMSQFYITQLRLGVPTTGVEDGIVATIYMNEEGKIIEASPPITMLVHWFPRELLGQDLTMIIPQRYHEKHKEAFAKVIQTGEMPLRNKTMALYAKTKDNGEVSINLKLDGWQINGKWTFGAVMWRRNDEPHLPNLDKIFVVSDNSKNE